MVDPKNPSEWDNLLDSLDGDAKKPTVPTVPPARAEVPTAPSEDEHDERTVIGVIPRELMAESMRGGAMRGGGLSQLLSRGKESEPAPSVESAPSEEVDADLVTSAPVPPPPPRPAPPRPAPPPPRPPTKTVPSAESQVVAKNERAAATPPPRPPTKTVPTESHVAEQERPTVPPPPEARAEQSSVESGVESAPGPKLHEPDHREYEPEDVTMIGPASFRTPAAAPVPSPVPEVVAAETEAPPPPPASARRPSEPPPSLPSAPASPWNDERDASTHLGETDRVDGWLERAVWLEAEARATEDRPARARGLLVVSELWAMAGDDERAAALALEAKELAPQHPLILRQVRTQATRTRDFDALIPALEAEGRSAPTPAGRLHAALLGAAVARAKGDGETAGKRLEQAARVLPSDPRAHLERISDELANPEKPPRHRVPDPDGSSALAKAVAELAAVRGDERASAEGPLVSLVRARAALSAGRVADVVALLSGLRDLAGVGEGALWLASALAAPHRQTRELSRELLSGLLASAGAVEARRALAARSLELGDAGSGLVLDGPDSPFSRAERAALSALLGRADALQAASELADESTAPLGAAIESSFDVPALPDTIATPDERAAIALGRALARGDAREDIVVESAELSFALSLDAVASRGDLGGLSQLFEREGSERMTIAALSAELAGDPERAKQLGAALAESVPDMEFAARLAASDAALDALASKVDDPVRRALLLLELATRELDQDDAGEKLLSRAHEASPELPLASSLGAHRARRRGDAEALVRWIRARRDAADDLSETAPDLVREALLTAGEDASAALPLLEQAAAANPRDLALADLIERFSGGGADGRGAVLLARAEAAPEASRARLALLASLELERDGDVEAAAKAAALAAPTSPLAALVRDRLDTFGTGAARLAEELMSSVRSASSPEAEREAYERLAYLDEAGRGDVASALLWHRSILERDATALPSLRRLEHALVGEGREEELDPILTAIAKATSGPESIAHARVALRLRQREGSFEAPLDLFEVAQREQPDAVWALRQRVALQGAAITSADRRAALEALAALTPRPLERATLLLRAAEHARDAGDAAGAIERLRSAVALAPEHPLVHRLLAQLLSEGSDGAAAALALDAAASASSVAAHQVQLRFDAAVAWIDRASDRVNGQRALETVLEADPTHEPAFERLRALFAADGEQEKLASLLERRLESEQDAQKRVELEVARGRALASLGQTQAARAALAAALEGSPDHVDALLAFAELSGQDGDWEGAEQSLIRLARLSSEPAQQAEIYLKLGTIYRLHLPNSERAEASYTEVQKRVPQHIGAQEALVEIYAARGDAERALTVQTALLGAAADPADKRRRTIDLARLHEDVTRDVRKAEQMLEALRKENPNDPLALRALAELHIRHNHGPAVNVLLDRAANDARRALGTGRFEMALFANLATVFELRGNADAGRVAQGTLAALEGHPSDVGGIGVRAAQRETVELAAPEVFTPALRELLRQAGSALDGATPIDLKGLRAAPFPVSAAGVQHQVLELAQAFGIVKPELYVSSAVGPIALPVSSSPPTLVLGASLVSEASEAVRTFLIVRGLTILRSNIASFSRTAPIDLWPMTAAFLQTFAPSWSPQSVDAGKLADFRARIQRALPPSGVGPEAGALALEVIGGIGNKASTLQTAANSWGTRVALLAVGDLSVGLDAIAFAAGQAGGAPTGADRLKWVGRHAEARDMVVFSVSNEHAEARKR